MTGLGWLLRSLLVLCALFVSYPVLLPVQAVSWLSGPHGFGRTEPYLWLRWVFRRGTAFPGELPITAMSYGNWREHARPQ